MNKAIIIGCLLTIWLPSVLAQSSQLQGRVSAGGEPIAFANVSMASNKLGAATNKEGGYSIKNIPYGNYHVVVSMVGFETQTKEIVISESQPIATLNFFLIEATSSLDEVVVSGTMKEVSKLESPVPVEVYSPLFFRANPTPSIFESLQNVNGVRTQLNCNVCNTGDIHINGLEGPYTMIMIDGMPIVSGLSTVYGLTGIPQSLIQRVEIVKGPASTLYGSEAVGGLINIITKNSLDAPLVSVDMMGTSWGEVNTDVGVKWKQGKAHSLVGVNYFNYQNPIDNNGDGFTDVTLQNRISIFNKWSLERKGNRTFSLAGRYTYEDRWGGEMAYAPRYRGSSDIYGESIYTNRWEVLGNYQLPVQLPIHFQFSATGHHQNSFYGTTSFNASQYIGFGQFTHNKKIANHDVLIGAALRYTYYDDNTPATARLDGTNHPSIIFLPGLFVQDELAFNSQHKLLTGVRYDYSSIHGSIFSPRLNYKWNTANKNTIIRVSVGNGYRVANVFTEDHAALTGARQVVFKEELKPETSWNGNLNLVRKVYAKNNAFINFDASAFYTSFNNRIVPDYETDPNKIIYTNLNGSAVSKGISLTIDASWPSGLKIIAGSTLMDVSLTRDGEEMQQLLTEHFSGVWSIGYPIGNGFSIDYTGNVYGPMRLPLLSELDNRAPFSPWWSIQNVQITKVFNNRFEVYGGVKNLLNYTPPANSIARPFDPFDKKVVFDANGKAVATPDDPNDNPNGLTFDPTYVFAPNQGIRFFIGVRYTLNR